VITVDLHADQIQGFFNIPVDHLISAPIFARYFKANLDLEDAVVVSPDSGGANRARAFARRLNASLAIGDKRRTDNKDNAEIMNIIGEVEGKTAILFDDIIDTGGSLCKLSAVLKQQGAKHVYAACAHGVLSGKALDNLEKSPIEKLFVTNTCPMQKKAEKCAKIVPLSIAELLATAIKKIHIEESISILFR
jgi:ribose-phosphate pyrophosphokinase